MLPSFVVIGGLKCGTTSLHYYLGLHPEIFMSREKELNFFVAERNWDLGVAWYRSNFVAERAGTHKALGETSPFYASYPSNTGVPRRMHSVIPDAKLVYVVRNPIQRALSQYQHWVALRREDRSLEEALGDLATSPLIQWSRYYLQLQQFLEYYPPTRILVVTSEDLLLKRAETLRAIFRFLEVDDSFTSTRFDVVRYQAADQRRKTWLGLLLSPLTEMEVVRKLPPPIAWRIRYLPYFPFATRVEKPVLDESLRREILDFLRSDIDQLQAFTGRDLRYWYA
jgi:hypothetical protein